MGTTRFTAEVDSETLARAREILNREQITLDETLQEMPQPHRLSRHRALLQVRRPEPGNPAGRG